MRKLISVVAVACLLLSGCSYQANAQKTANVISAIIAVAKAEAAVVPPADQAAYSGFVGALSTLDGQLNTCIAAASPSRKATFLACFNAFAAGLTTPAELAQLRILDKGVQGKVGLYVVSIVTGVNVALSFFGGPAVAAPPVITPTQAEMQQLADRIGYRGGW